MKGFPACLECICDVSRYSLSVFDGERYISTYLDNNTLHEYFNAEQIIQIKALKQGESFELRTVLQFGKWSKDEAKMIGPMGDHGKVITMLTQP